MGILCHAPYGYRYVNKHEGGGEARFEILFEEARIVQQVYTWVGQERCTINEVCRSLHQAGVHTRTGKEYWDHKTIWDMLKNPAYKGEAAFGKKHWVPNGPRLRVPRGKPAQPRRAFWGKEASKDEWITIPVPALVDPACLKPHKNNSKRTSDEHGSPRRGVVISCRGCWSVLNVGMPIMDVRMMHTMPTTAVVAQ